MVTATNATLYTKLADESDKQRCHLLPRDSRLESLLLLLLLLFVVSMCGGM